jgi:hypothetical protein
MNIGKPIEIGNDFPFLHVEYHKLIGIHVSDIKPTVGSIKALAVKPNGGSG